MFLLLSPTAEFVVFRLCFDTLGLGGEVDVWLMMCTLIFIRGGACVRGAAGQCPCTTPPTYWAHSVNLPTTGYLSPPPP